MNVIIKICNEVMGQLPGLIIKGRKIKNDTASDHYPASPILEKEVLLQFLQQEDSRRLAIEDKAKYHIIGITIAVTIMVASFVVLRDMYADSSHLFAVYLNISLLAVGVLFFLVGGLLALSILRAGPIHFWTLSEERTVTDAEKQNAVVERYLQHNQRQTMLKSNRLAAGNACLRNGLICFAIAFAMLVAMLIYDSHSTSQQDGPCSPANATFCDVSCIVTSGGYNSLSLT